MYFWTSGRILIISYRFEESKLVLIYRARAAIGNLSRGADDFVNLHID